jgi:hypothetical protein
MRKSLFQEETNINEGADIKKLLQIRRRKDKVNTLSKISQV